MNETLNMWQVIAKESLPAEDLAKIDIDEVLTLLHSNFHIASLDQNQRGLK